MVTSGPCDNGSPGDDTRGGPLHWFLVTNLIVVLPDDVAGRLADAAAERGVAPETLAGQLLAESFPSRSKLGFVALGRSTSGRRAAEDEDMLTEGFGR